MSCQGVYYSNRNVSNAVCVSMCCMWGGAPGLEEGFGSPGTRVTIIAAQCGCRGLNPGPQHELLPTDPSLQVRGLLCGVGSLLLPLSGFWALSLGCQAWQQVNHLTVPIVDSLTAQHVFPFCTWGPQRSRHQSALGHFIPLITSKQLNLKIQY